MEARANDGRGAKSQVHAGPLRTGRLPPTLALMNALIPMLVAVLLAETGPRGAQFAALPRRTAAIVIMALAIGAAATGGLLVAPDMSPRARVLLVAIALVFAGAGQFARVRPARPGTLGTVLMVARTGVPLLAFALACWQAESAGVVAGGLFGFIGAVVLSGQLPPRYAGVASRSGAGVLITTGVIVALSALRLIGS